MRPRIPEEAITNHLDFPPIELGEERAEDTPLFLEGLKSLGLVLLRLGGVPDWTCHSERSPSLEAHDLGCGRMSLGKCPAGFPKPAGQFLDEGPAYLGVGGHERPEGGADKTRQSVS